ncbi:hypothetical protein GQ54DRAFT_131653 [Martensiomyces pterosporus]|nr:hypothetical protein GQ54DRAFT_131653 [Martensiomyces pterosporus]
MASQSLESYYSAIKEAIAENNLPSVVDNARSGLKDYPAESEFAKIEVVALIKQENAAQALAAIARARTAKLVVGKALELEAAYCQFTLGNYEGAKKALKKAEKGPAATHLQAQIAYKQDQFDECIGLYEALIADAGEGSEEYRDLLLNLTAAKAAAAQIDQGRSSVDKGVVVQSDGYELMFNSATNLLARGRAQEAADLLSEAISLAKSSLAEEGWSADEIQGEVGPIEAQRAIALQHLGKGDEARAIFSRLLSGKSLDSASREVVSHNIATLAASDSSRRGASLSRVKRAIQVRGHASHSLSRFQRALMMYNMAAVQLSQRQYVAARRSLSRLGKSFSDVMIPNAGIVSASISLRMGNAQRALNELAAMSRAQGPEEGVHATLAAAQVAIELGESKRAAEILDAWRDRARGASLSSVLAPANFVHYYFGVSMLSDWLANGSAASTVPVDAAKHVYAELEKVQQPSASLLAAVGDCLAFAGDIEQARACFGQAKKAALEQGLDADTLGSSRMRAVLMPEGSKQSVAQLLKGYSSRSRVLKAVPGVSTRFARQFLPRSTLSHKKGAAKGNATPAAGTATKSSSEKYRARRQRRLLRHPPKNHDSERKPDSERWIPLRQRSYYKPRGRNRRQQKLRGGAQGGATEAGSGLGGTGSARIAGRTPDSPAQSVDHEADDSHGGEDNSASQQQTGGSSGSKSKSKGGKGKGKKGKGKKGGW